jgi:hypothetical protein
MGNQSSTGLHITPLTLWIAGVLGTALWAVLFAVGMRMLDRQEATQDIVTALATSQQYDRKEIDTIKGDVKAVQFDVRTISERLGKVEARR